MRIRNPKVSRRGRYRLKVNIQNCFLLEPALIAKSSVILDVKPWDDETDMTVTEKLVRGIQMEGLVWGACKFQRVKRFVPER